jgi:hypothetical protein
MAQIECHVCTTRFDAVFSASDLCPYCAARGVDPVPRLRKEGSEQMRAPRPTHDVAPRAAELRA